MSKSDKPAGVAVDRGVKHNALSDAVAQAQQACAVYKALFSKEKAKV